MATTLLRGQFVQPVEEIELPPTRLTLIEAAAWFRDQIKVRERAHARENSTDVNLHCCELVACAGCGESSTLLRPPSAIYLVTRAQKACQFIQCIHEGGRLAHGRSRSRSMRMITFAGTSRGSRYWYPVPPSTLPA
jgi:hypothetical protein